MSWKVLMVDEQHGATDSQWASIADSLRLVRNPFMPLATFSDLQDVACKLVSQLSLIPSDGMTIPSMP
jgi:hypothetical protein